MKLLSFLHRWTGGFLGLLLAILGLSGTILLWEGEWISLPGADDPVVENVADDRPDRRARGSRGRDPHHLRQRGDRPPPCRPGRRSGLLCRPGRDHRRAWSSQWERPELWIFDLHHHLFYGHTGELVAGWAGLLGLLFVITGAILWWRSRRAFRGGCGRKQFQPGPIVSHHRDIGILVAPLLLVSFVTGTGMIFDDVYKRLLARSARCRGGQAARSRTRRGPAPVAADAGRGQGALPRCRAAPPDPPGQARTSPGRCACASRSNGPPTAAPRFIFDGSGTLLRVDDPAAAGSARPRWKPSIRSTPAKVGGLAWKLLMTLSGLGLTLLGSLATWSFWFRKAKKRKRPGIAKAGLEVAAA